MKRFNTITVDDIRDMFVMLRQQQLKDSSAGMLELMGTTFTATNPTIFGVVSDKYVAAELAWYNSQSLLVADIPNTPAIWKAIANKQGEINSNYGWCIYSEANGYQYNNAKKALLADNLTRQAVMIYNRPSMHTDSKHKGMRDFICTNAVNYKLDNEGVLHATVQMRSNDAVFGYKNDYAWQMHILQKLSSDIGVKVGNIYWQAASLHVYERHLYLIDKYIIDNETAG